MDQKEYHETLIGTLIYGALGVLAAYLGWGFVMGFFGTMAVLRVYPLLRLPFIQNKKEQNKG